MNNYTQKNMEIIATKIFLSTLSEMNYGIIFHTKLEYFTVHPKYSLNSFNELLITCRNIIKTLQNIFKTVDN